jgi:hypothetical protein
MPRTFWWTSLDSGFRVATVFLGFDRQGWITVFAALVLAATYGANVLLN